MFTAPPGSGGVQADFVEQRRRFVALARAFTRTLVHHADALHSTTAADATARTESEGLAKWIMQVLASSSGTTNDAFAVDFFGAALESKEALLALVAEATSERSGVLPKTPADAAHVELLAQGARHVYCQERCRPSADHTWMENRFRSPFHHCFGV
jgi:hypothetical protein